MMDDETKKRAQERLGLLENKVEKRRQQNIDQAEYESRVLRVGFAHDAQSFRRVPHHKAHKRLLDKLFFTDIAALRDPFGKVLWPHEWSRKCLGPPTIYFIIEKQPNHTIPDAAYAREYIGESGLFLLNVPGFVDEQDLIAWFRAGLIGSDVRVTELTEAIRQAEDQLRRAAMALNLVREDQAEQKRRAADYKKGLKTGTHDEVVKAQAEAGASADAGTAWAGSMYNEDENSYATGQAAALAVLEDRRARLVRLEHKLRDTTIPALQLKLRELLTNSSEFDVRFLHICVHASNGGVLDGEDGGGSGMGDPLSHVHKRKPGAGGGGAKPTKAHHRVKTGEHPDDLHCWQVVLADDVDGSLANRALQFLDWPSVRLVPGSPAHEPLAFFTPPGSHRMDIDPEMEAQFRAVFADQMRKKMGKDVPFQMEVAEVSDEDWKKKMEDQEAMDEEIRNMCVNMRGVSVVRLRHGKGASRASSDLSLYTGGWHLGTRTGYGVEVSKAGIYEGNWISNQRIGRAFFQAYDGGLYQGPYEAVVKHRTRNRSLRDMDRKRVGRATEERHLSRNPYLTGVPHGKGKLTFADGSTYVGDIKDGRVTGRGVYTAANGEVFDGDFIDGALHGHGSHYAEDGTVQVGQWRHGMLAREALEVKPGGWVYYGQFKSNMYDGEGALIQRDGDAMYVGSFVAGHFHGAGTYMYRSNVKTDTGYKVEARWRGGTPNRGHVIRMDGRTTCDTQFAAWSSATLIQEAGSHAARAVTAFVAARDRKAADAERERRKKKAMDKTLSPPTAAATAATAAAAAATAATTSSSSSSTDPIKEKGDGTDGPDDTPAEADLGSAPKTAVEVELRAAAYRPVLPRPSTGENAAQSMYTSASAAPADIRAAVNKLVSEFRDKRDAQMAAAEAGSRTARHRHGTAGGHAPSHGSTATTSPHRRLTATTPGHPPMSPVAGSGSGTGGGGTGRPSGTTLSPSSASSPSLVDFHGSSAPAPRASINTDHVRGPEVAAKWHKLPLHARLREMSAGSVSYSTRKGVAEPAVPLSRDWEFGKTSNTLFNSAYYLSPHIQNMSSLANGVRLTPVPAHMAADELQYVDKAVSSEYQRCIRKREDNLAETKHRAAMMVEAAAVKHLRHWRRTRRLWKEEAMTHHGPRLPPPVRDRSEYDNDLTAKQAVTTDQR